MDFERKFDDMPPGEWEIWENPDEESNGYFRIAGTSYHFRECASVLENAPFELHFERDPHNRHDPNAIKIMSGSLHLGFVGKSDAGEIARNPDFPLMKPVLRSVWRGKFDDGTEAISIEYAILIPPVPESEKTEIHFRCSECGQHYKVDAEDAGCVVECVKCGKHLTVPDTSDSVTSKQSEKGHTECPVCRKKIDDTAKFCPHCGSSVSEIECQFCRKKISPMAKFCPHCGHPTSAAKSSPASSAMPQLPSSSPQQPGQQIRVDTGENVLNRNRGCADLLIGSVAIVIIIIILIALSHGCN